MRNEVDRGGGLIELRVAIAVVVAALPAMLMPIEVGLMLCPYC